MDTSAISSAETYAAMEEKIRPLVETLNRLGIVTICSCEGHLYSVPYPSVIIDHKACPRAVCCLIEHLAEYNFTNPGKVVQWELFPQFAYIYGRGGLFLYLKPRDENIERHECVLATMQSAIARLTEHLNAKAAPRERAAFLCLN